MMVKPIAYDSMWKKFEKDVFNCIKKNLEGKFIVEWNAKIKYFGNTIKPDIVVFAECNGEGYCLESCKIPIFIFDAFCKFNINAQDEYFKKKDERMKKYAKICDAVLVMPRGYEGWPYCRSSNDEYHIVNFQYLPLLLECLLKEVKFYTEEDACGYRLYCDTGGVWKYFELKINSKVDKCLECNSKCYPLSLIYCSKYDEYYHPDFLDVEVVEVKKGLRITRYTYAECDGCGDAELFRWNFENCPYSSIKYVYQCSKCGVIFDPQNNKIIENFEDSHMSYLTDFPYYRDKI